MEEDRSPMQGYPFFAHAELAVENSDVHLTARLCELSREGCRLEVKNPPLVGTSVLVKIYAWPYFLQVQKVRSAALIPTSLLLSHSVN